MHMVKSLERCTDIGPPSGRLQWQQRKTTLLSVHIRNLVNGILVFMKASNNIHCDNKGCRDVESWGEGGEQ